MLKENLNELTDVFFPEIMDKNTYLRNNKKIPEGNCNRSFNVPSHGYRPTDNSFIGTHWRLLFQLSISISIRCMSGRFRQRSNPFTTKKIKNVI